MSGTGIPTVSTGVQSREALEAAFKLFSQAMIKYHPQSMEGVMACNYASCLAWVLRMPKYMEANEAIISELRRVFGNEKTLDQVISDAERRMKSK